MAMCGYTANIVGLNPQYWHARQWCSPFSARGILVCPDNR
ncbi:hypothetical protein WA016_01907 [Myxococcus stipitatus]